MEDRTVLIIDDAAFMRQIMSDIISQQGQWFKVVGTADNGEQGVRMFGELKPDAVIVDIGLPDIDGMQVAGAIRALDPNAAIVMCSARGQLRTVLGSLQAGANHFIGKPFYPENLLAALNAALGGNLVYDTRTIARILEEERVQDSGDSLSQETIERLLDLCSRGGAEDNPEWAAL